MSRKGLRQNGLRANIAAAAARIMAEDGIDDFALAKRRAAKQLQVTESHALPGNDEIEAELKLYRSIYQPELHAERSESLLSLAFELMLELEAFSPYLTGPVLRGTAGPYTAIELQLFPQSAKEVEFFLLDRGIDHESHDAKRYSGERTVLVNVVNFDWEQVPVQLSIMDPREERVAIKSSTLGKIIERASISEVQAIIARGDHFGSSAT